MNTPMPLGFILASGTPVVVCKMIIDICRIATQDSSHAVIQVQGKGNVEVYNYV